MSLLASVVMLQQPLSVIDEVPVMSSQGTGTDLRADEEPAVSSQGTRTDLRAGQRTYVQTARSSMIGCLDINAEIHPDVDTHTDTHVV